MILLRISSLGACRLTASATGNASASLRMFGTTPEVESVTRRRESPYAKSSSIMLIASTTGWKLLSGSPMPIITTFETGRGEREISGREARGLPFSFHFLQAFICNPELADDLAHAKVAVEALAAGRAELAVERAA